MFMHVTTMVNVLGHVIVIPASTTHVRIRVLGVAIIVLCMVEVSVALPLLFN